MIMIYSLHSILNVPEVVRCDVSSTIIPKSFFFFFNEYLSQERIRMWVLITLVELMCFYLSMSTTKSKGISLDFNLNLKL